MRAQQDRSPHLNRALDKPLSHSLRWVPVDPEAVAAAATVRRQSLRGPAAAVAAAEAVAAVEAERAQQQQQQQQQQAQRGAGAPARTAPVGRESTVESPPEAPLDRYDSSLARLITLAPGAAAEAEELGRRQHPGWVPPSQQQASPEHPSLSQLQQQQHLPPPQQQQKQKPGQRTGPPNLAMLSATPSVGLDRYEAALTRPSMASTAGGSPLDSSPSGGTFETARSAGASSMYSAATGGSPFDTALSARSLPDEAVALQDQPQLCHPSPRFEPQPDLLASDLTATPSGPMERYAAMVAGEGEEAAAAAHWGARGGGGASSGQTNIEAGLQREAQHGSTYPPRHQPHPAGPLGRPPRPGMPISTAPAGGYRDLGQQMQQEASWHKRRSLANLASILEAGQEEEGSKLEQWPGTGGMGPDG